MNATAPIRVHRKFRHPVYLEETALRYNGSTGTVSSPPRPGIDGRFPRVYCSGQDIRSCRNAWSKAQAALEAEGFVPGETTFPEPIR